MRNTPDSNLTNLIAALVLNLQQTIAAEVTASVQPLIMKLIADQQRNPDALMTESDVVKMYKVSRSFLRKLRNEEGLPYLKIGDAVRFERAKLDEFFGKFNK